jgi:hypothetical protein
MIEINLTASTEAVTHHPPGTGAKLITQKSVLNKIGITESFMAGTDTVDFKTFTDPDLYANVVLICSSYDRLRMLHKLISPIDYTKVKKNVVHFNNIEEFDRWTYTKCNGVIGSDVGYTFENGKVRQSSGKPLVSLEYTGFPLEFPDNLEATKLFYCPLNNGYASEAYTIPAGLHISRLLSFSKNCKVQKLFFEEPQTLDTLGISGTYVSTLIFPPTTVIRRITTTDHTFIANAKFFLFPESMGNTVVQSLSRTKS